MKILSTALLALMLIASGQPARAQISFRAASSATVAGGVVPAFRAATSAVASGGTLTITKPSGTAANDVLISSVAVTPSSVAITPPTGWTLVRRTDNAGPTSNSLAVYYKVAGASEPTSYAWGMSGASFGVGGIQGFTGVDTANPINIENGQSTPSSTSHATPSITTTVANAMLVTSHSFASSSSWTPPSGMTESFDKANGSANATGLTVEGSRVLLAAAGASGTKTATAAANADAGNAHILALKPVNTSLSLATPTGTVAGDVMIAAIGFNNSSAAITAPTGWTSVRRTNNSNTTSNTLAVYRRTAASGEPASQVFAVAGGNFLVGGIQSFSGVDTTNPIDVENGQTTPSGTAHDTPSVVTSTANAMLVTAHTYASSNTWTPQSGLTEAYDRPSGNNNNTGQAITGTWALQATPGATGAKRSTAGGNADVGVTHILALRRFVPNSPPSVSLVSPTAGATFNAPASITLTATASDPDGTIQKVDFFYGGTNLITTVTTAPYTFTWTNVPQGNYSLTAVATDNQNASTTSAPVSITVNRVPGLQFVHVDHLNTPRAIYDDQQHLEWKWDQQEPFGDNAPDENPSGLGSFTFPLRFQGQYADNETTLAHNFFRDYSASIGRYEESDPIGLRGGLNTYAYVRANPLRRSDRLGLWGIGGFGGGSIDFGDGRGNSIQAQSGVGLFGNSAGFSIGAYTASRLDNSAAPSSENFVIGASAGLASGIFATTAPRASDLAGPFDTWTLNIPAVSIQVATDGTTWIVSLNFLPSWGASFSRVTVTTENTWDSNPNYGAGNTPRYDEKISPRICR
ncbi:MAG TPA: Ig-like domain-containing protein [Burkholderiales bacterium]|nr:Ig-like domain-containing protein [Burkholderiales bacterium]